MVYFVMFAVICCFSQRKVKSVKNLIRPLKLLEAIKLLTFLFCPVNSICLTLQWTCDVLKPPFPPPASEEDVLKGKQSIRGQALGNQNSESETLLDGDDDTVSSLEEKDLDNLTGKETSRCLHLSPLCPTAQTK